MTQVPSTVKLEHISCPNGCIQESKEVLKGRDRLHNLPGTFSIVRCPECGLERTNPRPTPDTIGFYYPDEYGPYQATQTRAQTSGAKARIYSILGLEDRKLPKIPPGRMLEIGCSSGSYMEYARDRGWEVEGIEFSPSVADKARSKGFEVQSGPVESASPPKNPFNVIVGWMVLEHLHQPIEVLRKLRSWTSRDGLLIVSVPDRDNIARRIFGSNSYDLQLPTHLFHFNPQSLEKTLNTAGWKVERIFWQRNCNTLMKSIEYWATERDFRFTNRLINASKTGRISSHIRTLLGILLGITKQSGRIEVWATPIDADKDKECNENSVLAPHTQH